MQFTLDVSPEDIKAGEKISQNTAAKARAANNEVEKAAPAPKKKTEKKALPPHVEEYIEKGWTVIPLPAGEKFPPKSGTTGNIPPLTKDEILECWATADENNNVGLRTPDNVIVLDVDQYNGKTGDDNLNELLAVLGVELPPTVMSKSRGDDNPSRHLFYRVPAGFKWESQVCDDVDIVQASHRYVVAAPSKVEGREYRWFSADGQPLNEIPSPEDFAELPPALTDALKKGPLTFKGAPTEDYAEQEALDWLVKMTVDFLAGEPSAAFKTGLEKVDMAGGAHDEMVRKQRWAVRHAVVEGETGLRAALEELQRLFLEEMASRSVTRVSPERAKAEFGSALVSEINNVRGEIEHGLLEPFVSKYADLEADLSTTAGAEEAAAKVAERNKAADDIVTYSTGPMVAPELLALLNPGWVAVQNKDDQSQIFDLGTRRRVGSETLRGKLIDEVRTEISRVVDSKAADDEEDLDVLEKKRNAVTTLAGQTNLTALTELLAVALRDKGRGLRAEDIDANPYLIGSGDDVIDLKVIEDNPGGWKTSEVIRPREFSDAVMRDIGWDFREALEAMVDATRTEELIETVFPDEEVRRFAQKSLGYSIFGSNKEHKFFVWQGDGGGGKGSLFDNMVATLGMDEYVSNITPEQFIKGSSSRPDPKYAASLGTRVTFVDEASAGTRMDATSIKRGTEVRSGRRLNDNNVQTSDGNTITFMTNHAFEFEHDDAVGRRLAVIPFVQKEKVVAEFYKGKSKTWREEPAERAYMMLWLLRGFEMACVEGLSHRDYPPAIRKATARFVRAADPLLDWLSSAVKVTGDKDDTLAARQLNQLALNSDEFGKRELTPQEMKRARDILEKDGATVRYPSGDPLRVDGKRGFRGVRLADPKSDTSHLVVKMERETAPTPVAKIDDYREGQTT